MAKKAPTKKAAKPAAKKAAPAKAPAKKPAAHKEPPAPVVAPEPLHKPEPEPVQTQALAVIQPDTPTTIITEHTMHDGAVTISKAGAKFSEEATLEQVEATMVQAAQAARGGLYVLGDAVNHAAQKWGDQTDRWAKLTGMEPKQIVRASRVTLALPESRRVRQLSFDHMLLVSGLPEGEQEKWMDAAEEQAMSVPLLRKSLSAGEVLTPEQAKPDPKDKGIETVVPHVNRIVGFFGKLKKGGALDGFTAEQLFALHRDMLPVMREHAKVIALLKAHEDRPSGMMQIVTSDLSKALAQ